MRKQREGVYTGVDKNGILRSTHNDIRSQSSSLNSNYKIIEVSGRAAFVSLHRYSVSLTLMAKTKIKEELHIKGKECFQWIILSVNEYWLALRATNIQWP